MSSEVVRLTQALRDEMVAHALAGAPLEACGLIGGTEEGPKRFYPAVNAAQSPVRYNVDPKDLLEITLDIESRGWRLWGIFHSHPATEAYPSQTDLRLAFYPDAVYLICSLADPKRPHIRAYRIQERLITELPVEIGGA